MSFRLSVGKMKEARSINFVAVPPKGLFKMKILSYVLLMLIFVFDIVLAIIPLTFMKNKSKFKNSINLNPS